MIQKLLCLVGRHHRSARRAHREGDGTMRSCCRGCRKPMERGPRADSWSLVA